MPSLSSVLRVETGPGHAGIDGHAALHLNPLPDSYCVNKHGRQFVFVFSTPGGQGIKQANAWSCRFRKPPSLNLSLGE